MSYFTSGAVVKVRGNVRRIGQVGTICSINNKRDMAVIVGERGGVWTENVKNLILVNYKGV